MPGVTQVKKPQIIKATLHQTMAQTKLMFTLPHGIWPAMSPVPVSPAVSVSKSTAVD
jgi:hypothetical protein